MTDLHVTILQADSVQVFFLNKKTSPHPGVLAARYLPSVLSLVAISQAPPDFTSGQSVAFTPAVSPSLTQAFPVLLLWANLAHKEHRLSGKAAPQVTAAWGTSCPAGTQHTVRDALSAVKTSFFRFHSSSICFLCKSLAGGLRTWISHVHEIKGFCKYGRAKGCFYSQVSSL